MTLEQIFYILAIIYIVAWLLFLIGVIIFSFIAYRRMQEVKRTVEDSAVAAIGLKLLKPTPLKGLVALIPVAQFFAGRFFDRRKKS